MIAVEWDLRLASAATYRRNMHTSPLVIYPSPAYGTPFLRDSFWIAQALNNRRFSIEVLGRFAAAQRADGDPPTSFLHAYTFPSYHDDESAALFLIWAWRNKSLYGVTPPLPTLQRALAYLLRRTTHGYLITPAGTYGSWWDAYPRAHPSTLSYDQGVYAVALRAAQALGLPLPPHAIALAELAYRALYNARLGYFPVSTWLPASDASALTGEFLSLWLFGHPMLTDAVVLSTLHHLTPFGAGFCVVTLPGLNPKNNVNFPFIDTLGNPGDYQNGASWLLYDALTIGAAGLHGWTGALAQLRARLVQEFRYGRILHEYLTTNPTLPYYGREPPYRDIFSWDTFVMVVDDVLRGKSS